MIIGLDMGGTNIDAVIIKDNKILKTVKKPVDNKDILNSILNVIETLLIDINPKLIKKVNLSTTISTNAVVLNKLNKVGLIIQTGPGLSKDFIITNNHTHFISGYTDHRGVVVKEFKLEEIKKAMKDFDDNNIKDVLVVTKFSTRNNKTELEIATILNNKYNVTLGHLMSGRLNFIRRINTAYLNAAVKPTFLTFSNAIKEALKKLGVNAPINILKADSGVMDINYAETIPVETILSGPAASLLGMIALNDNDGDQILLDIGGTTTDIFFLANNIPLFEPHGIEISNYKTLVRSIYSKSNPLGGDSLVKVLNNEIIIGPERLDKAYALGGKYPTPTDALIVLKRSEIGNYNKAIEGLYPLARKLNLSVEQIAELIVDKFSKKVKEKVDEALKIINSKPVYTIKEILNDKKIEPNHLFVIGASAKAFSSSLEKTFNIKTNYPLNFEVANAIGAALAKTTSEINLTYNAKSGLLTVPELGVNKNIDNLTLKDAKTYALKLLKKHNIDLGGSLDESYEIFEESSFNMVDGFYTIGTNIRIRAQVKPGLTKRLGGLINEN